MIDNQPVGKVTWESYSVIQKPGFALGYQIIPTSSEIAERADFAAFKVTLDPQVSHYSVSFSDSRGNLLGDSQRVILRASSNLKDWVVIFLLFPVLIGLGLSGYQFYRRKQNAKVLSQKDGT